MYSHTHAVYQPNRTATATDVGGVSVRSGANLARTYADTAQIEAFVLKHENRIYRTALAIMGNRADAEDVMQEIFLKIVQAQNTKPFSFESDQHEEAWLTRVTVNRCKTLLRTPKWGRIVSLEELSETHGVVCKIDGKVDNEKAELMEKVNSLPPKQRIAVYLFYYEGYSTQEVAELTKQNESTVRSHLARARKKLKQLISDDDD
jgi:RNA polymerase sigma-70 factor (ECF subfamily)